MKQLFLVLAVLILLVGCGPAVEYDDFSDEEVENETETEDETEEVQEDEEEIEEDFFADEDDELEVEPVI